MRRLLTILTIIFSVLFTRAEEYRHVHYDDHDGMSQWHITKMLQDKKGFIWFSTWNGLDRYDGYDFQVFKSKAGDGIGLTSDRFRNMMLGEDGNIYCVSGNHVWRFNLTTYKFEIPEKALQERYLARFKSDQSVQDKTKKTIGGYEFLDVRQVMTDSQKNIWVMCEYGVEKLIPSQVPATILTSVPQQTIRAIFRDNQKRIWIGSRDDKGWVAVLDNKGDLIGFLGMDGKIHKNFIPFMQTYVIYQQSPRMNKKQSFQNSGTMWFGSKPHGLFRMRGTKIDHFFEGVPVYDVKEDSKGRLWVGTQFMGLYRIDNPDADNPKLTKVRNFPEKNAHIRRIKILGDSLMLFTTAEGFVVGRNFMGSVDKMSFNLHTREAKRTESLSCSACMDMLRDRKGRLFITTESGGVDMVTSPSLSAKVLSFRHFDTTNGMGSDAALAMAEIGDEILVQCNNQVSRINVDMGVIENFNDQFFSIASRFSDAEPVLLPGGKWLLSMEKGILMVEEEKFHNRGFIPRIVITSVDTPGKDIDYAAENTDTITLGTSERDVHITYSALDYTDNSHIKYITRVITEHNLWSNDTTAWKVPQSNRSLSLYNLHPGTYKVEIRSTNAEGLWVDNTRVLTIVVEPAFYETWYATLLFVIIIVIVIVGITYTIMYIRTLKRQREEHLQAYLALLDAQQENREAISNNESSNQQPQIIAPSLSEEDEAFMRRLIDFVEKNIGESSAGVDEMASATATSRSSLNRKMKHILGVTPADFLKEARMKKACQLLTTTNKNINDIAYTCGFSDPKYFSKVFRAERGMSPSDFRAENR